MSAEGLEELRLRKLQLLLEHAYVDIPYYRDIFSGLDAQPEDIKTFSDLRKFPVLTKDIIRQQGERMVSAKHKKHLIKSSTGGSTGAPLSFYSHKMKETLNNAAKYRGKKWWGVDIGQPELLLWGNPVELNAENRLRAWKDRFLNVICVSAYNLSEAALDRFAEVIDKFRPAVLYVYPSALVTFCEHVKKNGRTLNYTPRYVVATAESMLPRQKDIIERTLRTKVIVEYGAHDGGLMAYECPCGRLHSLDDLVHLEIVDSSGEECGEDKAGEVLVTNLDSYGMPFIRYSIGDRASRGKTQCEAGRGFGSLKSLDGRVSENLIHIEGHLVPGLYLTSFMRCIPGVLDFQVRQQELGVYEVSVVTDLDYTRSSEEAIKAELAKGLGGGIDVKINQVENIPVSDSGKKRWVICDVKARK